jgi:N-acetylmuramoyl-L-alanine amidase
MEIQDRPSPNHDARRGGLAPALVVLHYTAMDSAEAALERMCDPATEVSTHYLIGRDGAVYRLVEERRRAWHAGAGRWAGREDINSRSIGIEMDNDGTSRFDAPLMASLEALLRDILDRHDLHPKSVIAHSDMAPDRKSDPGRRFDWERLAGQGLSIWPEAAMPRDFMREAAAFGYPVEKGEALVLEAFRQRFRPEATGPLDPADRSMMAGLARHYPADVTERIARRVPSRPLSQLR